MSFKAKEDEAAALMKSGKKHITKSLTKWSLDHDSAAMDFEKAAKIYTHLGNVKLGKDAWLAASASHEVAKNLFFSGKALETCAGMLKDDAAFAGSEEGQSELSDLYIRASRIFALDGKPERQADMLQRAAKITPASKSKEAAAKMVDAIDALEDNDKHHYCPDAYRALILLLVRNGSYTEAIPIIKRAIKTYEKLQQPASGAKAGLEMIILCAATGDWVLADREFRTLQDAYGFAHSQEQNAAFSLLDAIEQRDDEALQHAVKNESPFQFIIPEIARIAKKLKASTMSNVPPPKKSVIHGATTAATGGKHDEVEEDEEDLR